jgi:hypothetical protein
MSDLNAILQRPVNIVLAVILVDIFAMILARNNIAGNVINEWYNKFTFGAFVADIASICFGIFLSLFLFKNVFPKNSFTPVNFIVCVVLIQLLHDLLFSIVIRSYPSRQNKMMDLFKSYVNENSWKILLVDAIMMISSVLLIYLFLRSNLDDIMIYTLLAFALYFAQFLIYS